MSISSKSFPKPFCYMIFTHAPLKRPLESVLGMYIRFRNNISPARTRYISSALTKRIHIYIFRELLRNVKSVAFQWIAVWYICIHPFSFIFSIIKGQYAIFCILCSMSICKTTGEGVTYRGSKGPLLLFYKENILFYEQKIQFYKEIKLFYKEMVLFYFIRKWCCFMRRSSCFIGKWCCFTRRWSCFTRKWCCFMRRSSCFTRKWCCFTSRWSCFTRKWCCFMKRSSFL